MRIALSMPMCPDAASLHAVSTGEGKLRKKIKEAIKESLM
jgi:hypothetical protein